MANVRIYHNPECSDCRKIAAMHHRLDWLGRLETKTDVPPSGPLKLGQIAVQDLSSGEFLEGAKALRKIFLQVPLYLPLVPLTFLPAFARKYADTVVGCRDGVCEVTPKNN